MDCFDVKELLSASLDDELNATSRDSVARHLRECTSCQAEYVDFQVLSKQVQDLPDARPPARVWAKIDRDLSSAADRQATPVVTATRSRASNRWDIRAAWAVVAASVLLTMSGGAWFYYTHSSHGLMAGHSTEFLATMDRYFDRFPGDPAGAERFLIEKYHGKSIDASQAVKVVGYQPRVMQKMPDDYQRLAANVLKMPCCTCVEARCQRSDGSTLVLFEHDDRNADWFGDRPTKNAVCGNKSCCLVELDSTIAATWKVGPRFVTAVGLRDPGEVDRLVQWFDQNSRPQL